MVFISNFDSIYPPVNRIDVIIFSGVSTVDFFPQKLLFSDVILSILSIKKRVFLTVKVVFKKGRGGGGGGIHLMSDTHTCFWIV